RHHRGVHRRRAGAQVLAILRAHIRRHRQENIRQLRADDLPDSALVSGIQVGVQEADHDGLDTLVPQSPRSLAHLVEVEWLEHAPLVVEALGYLETEASRHERRRLLQMDVIEARADLTADLEDV